MKKTTFKKAVLNLLLGFSVINLTLTLLIGEQLMTLASVYFLLTCFLFFTRYKMA